MKYLPRLLLFCIALAGVPLLAALPRCAVCGMEINSDSKTSFSGTDVKFCSFVCAHSYHQKFPKVNLMATDFETGRPVKTEGAYFVIKSKNLFRRKGMELEMPPPIVAFSSEKKALALQADLKDGKVVKGFKAVEREYE